LNLGAASLLAGQKHAVFPIMSRHMPPNGDALSQANHFKHA
jgi:hypothetical protein